MQTILTSIPGLKQALDGLSAKRVFLVCDPCIDLLGIKGDILRQVYASTLIAQNHFGFL